MNFKTLLLLVLVVLLFIVSALAQTAKPTTDPLSGI